MSNIKKLTNLIEEASSLADETFANKQWVEWFNNGLDDLADVLLYDKVVDIAAVNGAFPMPTDLRTIISVGTPAVQSLPMLQYQNSTDTGYKFVDNKVYLQGASDTTITLYYYRLPVYFSTNSDVDVDLPNNFTRALIYFACAQAMIQEDESDRYEIFMQRYVEAKSLIFKLSQNKRAGSAGSWGVVR